ncbi:hypothetical protein B0T20DRAFT_470141 [Sordaria brevicollis]|uniref:Uncharacterized protein n=1 Tax=Sordaria brevicollis TaxID=83679 RepID=A0AAE0UBA8_SORBR|nr:hypothetical protein B0T20DRAFT_470141 [Sordaria brevicollis]
MSRTTCKRRAWPSPELHRQASPTTGLPIRFGRNGNHSEQATRCRRFLVYTSRQSTPRSCALFQPPTTNPAPVCTRQNHHDKRPMQSWELVRLFLTGSVCAGLGLVYGCQLEPPTVYVLHRTQIDRRAGGELAARSKTESRSIGYGSTEYGVLAYTPYSGTEEDTPSHQHTATDAIHPTPYTYRPGVVDVLPHASLPSGNASPPHTLCIDTCDTKPPPETSNQDLLEAISTSHPASVILFCRIPTENPMHDLTCLRSSQVRYAGLIGSS